MPLAALDRHPCRCGLAGHGDQHGFQHDRAVKPGRADRPAVNLGRRIVPLSTWAGGSSGGYPGRADCPAGYPGRADCPAVNLGGRIVPRSTWAGGSSRGQPGRADRPAVNLGGRIVPRSTWAGGSSGGYPGRMDCPAVNLGGRIVPRSTWAGKSGGWITRKPACGNCLALDRARWIRRPDPGAVMWVIRGVDPISDPRRSAAGRSGRP